MAPETPDFDRIAREVTEQVDVHVATLVVLQRDIREQLRLVWNARGAADIALIETISPFPTKVSLDALRKLDR